MIKVFGYLLSRRKAVLFIADIVVISISGILSAVFWLGLDYGLNYVLDNILSFSLMAFTFLLMFYIADIYNSPGIVHNTEQIITIITAGFLSFPVSALLIYMFNLVMIGRKVFILYGIIIIFGIILTRLVLDYLASQPIFKTRTAAIGIGEKVIKKLEKLAEDKEIGLEFINIKFDDYEDLEDQICRHRIEQIITTDNNLSDKLIYSLSALALKGIKIIDIPQFFQEYFQKIPIDYISNDWLYNELKKKPYVPYIQNIKQVMDIILAFIIFVVTIPLYIPIALSIKLTSSGPVFYIQKRLGKNGRSFNAVKFRSMIDNAESEIGVVWAKENDNRITVVGKFLRKTRLDELPQLINVLKGEMSLIGPRPEREEFIRYFIDKAASRRKPLYKEEYLKKIPYYAIRLLVKPGITGWAQVNNGYVNTNGGTKEKLEYELYYILNQSILLDLSILFKTISIILLRKGI